MATTSDGLRALLQRHNNEPTGDSKKDVALARQFMPASWSDMLAANKNIKSKPKLKNRKKINDYYSNRKAAHNWHS